MRRLNEDTGFENPKGQLRHLPFDEAERLRTLMCTRMYHNFNKRYTLDSVYSARGLHSKCVRVHWECYHDNMDMYGSCVNVYRNVWVYMECNNAKMKGN